MAGKVVFFFDAGSYGWSESYYSNSSDLNQLFTKGLALAQDRSRLLADPASLNYIRCSVEGFARVATLTAVGPGTSYPLPRTTFTEAADKVETCALIQAFATGGAVQRKIYLRGSSDLLFDRLNPTNADVLLWDDAFNNYFVPELNTTANGWAIKKRVRPGGLIVKKPITQAINVPGTGNCVLTVSVPTTAAAGDYVQIYALKGAIPNPGIVRVLLVQNGGNDVTVHYTLPAYYNFTSGGYLIESSFTYEQIDYVQYERTTSHKTGRPFGLSRGRRRAIPR